MDTYDGLPVGKLGIVTIKGCEKLTEQIDYYLREWRGDSETFKINTDCPRFTTGEAKGIVKESVRGYDIFILVDVLNYGVTYNMYGKSTPMSPDDHYADLKRTISAMGGKARRITVVMPMLYESRQHRRQSRESLDCALALQELVAIGVDNIITFDAHDPRVQNAIPLSGFENAQPYYQMIKALLRTVPNLQIDKDNCMIVAPDNGAMPRCLYYSAALELDVGMFYKRRDFTTIVNGRNPIIEHTFLGGDVAGKDIIIAEDMISSGESVFDVCTQMKERGAKRIFVFATFGFFVEGLAKLDQAHKNGLFENIFTTNLIYRMPELNERSWYVEVDMSKYISMLINTLNYDKTISELLNPLDKIKGIIQRYKGLA
jgi:ribose-phosphate pyrophosphokinase